MNGERMKAIVTIVVTAAINIVNLWGYAVDVDSAVNAALTIASFAAIVYSWWFNQNVTPEAQQAQAVLDHLRAEKKALHAKDGD